MPGKKRAMDLRGIILLTAGMLLLTLTSCASQTAEQIDYLPPPVSSAPAAEQSAVPQSPWEGGEWASSLSGFTSDSEGWFVGSSGVASGYQENYVYLTHDGGVSWEETGNVNAEWPHVLTCAAFANDQIGFLCFRYDAENFGRIYRTTDAGKTWAQFDLGLIWNLPDNAQLCGEARSISFDGSGGNGTIEFLINLFGDDPGNGSILTLTTSDFGATWMSASSRPAAQPALADLPADYSEEDAIADDVYVNVQGSEVYNQETVDLFYMSAFAGLPASMRTMEYTDEGDPIITDYSFDGKLYTVTTDISRDKFAGADSEKITTATYQYLVPFDHSRPQGALEDYYLSNDLNIFTETSDGGTTLIDGLERIPLPSDDVKRP